MPQQLFWTLVLKTRHFKIFAMHLEQFVMSVGSEYITKYNMLYISILSILFTGELVKHEIQKSQISAQHEIVDVQAAAIDEPQDEDDIWCFLDNKLNNRRFSITTEDSGVPIQLRHYIRNPPVCRKTNPNPFLVWRVMENEYPFISKVAKKFYLS